jgi:hypothetical protein
MFQFARKQNPGHVCRGKERVAPAGFVREKPRVGLFKARMVTFRIASGAFAEVPAASIG